MTVHALALLPIDLMHRGIGGGIVACLVFAVYAVILWVVGISIFQMVNYTSVPKQTGTAVVLAKRIIPRHRELQGRALVTVPEYEVLDVQVNGQLLVHRPLPWILERVTAHTDEPVEFVAGRLNGKIRITKFKYL